MDSGDHTQTPLLMLWVLYWLSHLPKLPKLTILSSTWPLKIPHPYSESLCYGPAESLGNTLASKDPYLLVVCNENGNILKNVLILSLRSWQKSLKTEEIVWEFSYIICFLGSLRKNRWWTDKLFGLQMFLLPSVKTQVPSQNPTWWKERNVFCKLFSDLHTHTHLIVFLNTLMNRRYDQNGF